MWKRANKAALGPRSIGDPTLLETTLDEASAAKLTDLPRVQRNGALLTNVPAVNKDKSLPAVPRSDDEHAADSDDDDEDDDAASAAAAAIPPPLFSGSRGAGSSSMAAQPPARLDIPRSSASAYSHEISPPDSPHMGDMERSSSPNISPITDGGSSRHGPPSARLPPTAIPQPVATNAGGASSTVAGWRESISGPSQRPPKRKEAKPTLWDKYSGEPTDTQRGRAGYAQPGNTAFDRPPMGHSTTITATPRPSTPPRGHIISQTLKKVGMRDSGSSGTSRDEWKGPGGRHAIVDPVSDKPKGKMRSLPTPSQRRNRQAGKASAAKHALKEPQTSPTTETARQQTASASPPTETVSEDNSEQSKTRIADEFQRTKRFSLGSSDDPQSPPERTSSLPPSHVTSPITPVRQAQSNQPSPVITKAQPPVQSPVQSPVQAQEQPKGPYQPRFNPQVFTDPQIASALESLGFRNEPGSRFSDTTYATTLPGSRPDTPNSVKDGQSDQQTSILNRKRPVPSMPQYPGNRGSTKAPTRKPTPSQVPSVESEPTPASSPPPPPPPPPPAEPEEVDKVSQLESQISRLTKRKQNLITVINELTNVAQPTSSAYDHASRTEIKKTVSGMKKELESVTKEIHETGLKLHRALRKRDYGMSGEASGLWIRRVTE